MSVLISSATGNLSASGTWSLVDATSYNNSEAANTALTTSSVGSTTFVPAAAAIGAVAVKIASVNAVPSGTMTVELFNFTTSTIVQTTTINVSDLPLATTANNQGGWIVFKFSGTTTPNGTDSYSVRAKTSVASQVNLYSSATTNWSRVVRTTTAQAPVSGDTLIVAGEHTGAGTGNSFTVTMDSTGTTIIPGAGTTGVAGLVAPAISICKRGTLAFGNSASTNYVLKLTGSIVVYGQGTFNIGVTGGSEIPRTSTATLQFACTADADFGLVCRNESTFSAAGLSRTSAKNVIWCSLNADASAAATSLSVDTDTGWLSGDAVVLASTDRYADTVVEHSELLTLSGNATSIALAVGALAFAHSGSSGTYTAADGQTFNYSMQAEIILLTRNVVIQSSVTTADAYMYSAITATVTMSWVELIHMGGVATAGLNSGIVIDTGAGGTFSLTFFSLHNSRNNGINIAASAQTNWNNITIQHGVFYNLATASATGVAVGAIFMRTDTTQTNWIVDDIVVILSPPGITPFFIRSIGGTFTNIRASSIGSANGGNVHFERCATRNTNVGPFVIHSNKANPVGSSCAALDLSATAADITIPSIMEWRNAGGTWFQGNGGIYTINQYLSWGDTGFPLGCANNSQVTVSNGFIAGDTTHGCSQTIWWDQAGFDLTLNNMDLSPTQGIFVPCGLEFSNQNTLRFTMGQIVLRNCTSGATTRFQANNLLMGDHAFISFERLGRTAGSHLTRLSNGTLTTDSVIFNTAAPSMRMTPNNEITVGAYGLKLPSAAYKRGVKVPVANGVSGKTVSVWVRKSISTDAGGANYNGNQQRLVQRANAALGQSSDVVLATAAAAVGVWEQLTGTISTPTDDGAFEFVVDCDGTAGWVNVDDWTTA